MNKLKQGNINAICVQLDLDDDKTELKKYASNLSENERLRARHHLMTVRALKKCKLRR